VKDSTFDLGAFNPPYLTDWGSGDKAVEGDEAHEVPSRFLGDAVPVVKKEGRVVLLLVAGAEVEQFSCCAPTRGSGSEGSTRHLFFEDLSVYEASLDLRA
jgi:hypothetical protein